MNVRVSWKVYGNSWTWLWVKGTLVSNWKCTRRSWQLKRPKNAVCWYLSSYDSRISLKLLHFLHIQSRPNVEEAIQLLLGGSSSDNLLSEFNSRLNSTSTSLAQKQQKITSLGKETASIEADIRNTRSHLETKRSELNGTFQVDLKKN